MNAHANFNADSLIRRAEVCATLRMLSAGRTPAGAEELNHAIKIGMNVEEVKTEAASATNARYASELLRAWRDASVAIHEAQHSLQTLRVA